MHCGKGANGVSAEKIHADVVRNIGISHKTSILGAGNVKNVFKNGLRGFENIDWWRTARTVSEMELDNWAPWSSK